MTASLGHEVLQQQILVAEFGVTQHPGVIFPSVLFSHLSIRIKYRQKQSSHLTPMTFPFPRHGILRPDLLRVLAH